MKKNNGNIRLCKHNVDYFDSVALELAEAEETISGIKKSKEWKSAYHYFNTLINRGYLDKRPTKDNKYKIGVISNCDLKLYKKHVDYLNSVVPDILEAEETINRIKKSKEWKRAYDYFSLLEHRGLLKIRPTKKNKYKYEIADERPRKKFITNKCLLLTWDKFQEIVETVSNDNVSIRCADGEWFYIESEEYNSEYINSDLSKYFKKNVKDVLIDIKNDNNCVAIIF